MSQKISKKGHHISAGDCVRVRDLAQIATTLDSSGSLDGLPFMPEMGKYCGLSFIVRRQVHKLIQEGVGSSLRRIKDVVLLDGAFCDGHAHGDCQRACFPLWKTAWLDLIQDGISRAGEGEKKSDAPRTTGLKQTADVCLAGRDENNAGIERILEIPNRPNVCQVTELIRATTPLPLWHPVRYLIDIKSKTYSPREYTLYLLGGIYKKTLGHILSRMHRKSVPIAAKAPIFTDPLGLQPGDLVEVRSVAEIQSTLDGEGKTRGLYFMPCMLAFCGRRLRVLGRVDRMMSEKTGELRTLQQTVLLEDANCDGKANGGCQRGCYVFWKDTWLKRL